MGYGGQDSGKDGCVKSTQQAPDAYTGEDGPEPPSIALSGRLRLVWEGLGIGAARCRYGILNSHDNKMAIGELSRLIELPLRKAVATFLLKAHQFYRFNRSRLGYLRWTPNSSKTRRMKENTPRKERKRKKKKKRNSKK